MDDRDPVAVILQGVEHLVAPDRRFTQNLLDELLEELVEDEDPHGRKGRGPHLSRGWRKTLTIAAAFAIALAAFALLRPFARQDALPESVRELGPFPPVSFRGTIVAGRVDQATSTRIGDATYASQFSWKVSTRGDYLSTWGADLGDAGVVARDGDGIVFYSSRTNSTRTLAVRSATAAPVYSPARLLTWTGTQAFSWAAACASGAVVGDERIGGNLTVRVSCPDVKLLGSGNFPFRGEADVWVDPSNGMVLRIETAATRAGASDTLSLFGPLAGQRWELKDLQVGGVTSATFTPPSDAIDATGQTVLTSVRLGQPMPKVELPLIGGGTTSLDGTLGTPTAIYYWDGTCFDESDCSPLRLVDFLAARRGIDAIVVISQRYSGSPWVPGRIPQADASVRVATDPDGVASGLVAADMTYDMLLLLDPGGNLVAVYSAGFGKGSGGVLGRILDAFAAGEALPRHPGGQAEAQLP